MTSLPAPAHPAPAAHTVGSFRVLVNLFGAPLAWLAQMSLSEPIAAQACYPHVAPLPAPLLAHLQALLAAVTLGALAVGIACTFLAWASWSAVSAHAREADAAGYGDTAETGDGRTRFLAIVSVMASLLFLTAIMMTGLAVLLVSPCHGWG